MYKNRKKLTSIYLILCFLITLFTNSLYVYAAESNESVIWDNAEELPVTSEKLVLSSDDVPEAIGFAQAQEKGHVMRMREKEGDNCTVVFLNEDNTETMYVFAEPIKYTDNDGNTKDKSTILSLSGNKYITAQNDINVSFPQNINSGVSVTKGDICVSMTPAINSLDSGNLSVKEIDGTVTGAPISAMSDNRMIYSDVFGTGIDLQYTPTYTGFKEDIIIESYSGAAEFTFTVNTNGLYPVLNGNGSVSFLDPSTDKTEAKMMQIVCYDANNKFAGGDVRITQIKQNLIYSFTIIPDAEFLSDESTVYPVCVDPTITLNTEAAIEDAVIYSGKPDRNYGDYKYSTVGYLDSSYGTGRLFIRFPTLANNSTFQSLDETLVQSATLSIYTASSKSNTTFNIYRYETGSWTESTITWNNIKYYTDPVSVKINNTAVTAPSSGSAKMDFDITAAVQLWASGSTVSSPDRGVIIMSTAPNDASVSRDFLNVEYALSASSRTQYMPCLEIKTYDIVEVLATADKTTIEVGEKTSINAYVNINGELFYNNGTIMSFHFINSDGTYSNELTSPNGVLKLNSTLGGQVEGLKKGSAAVRVLFNQNTSKYVDITITVTATISGSSTYTINNDNTKFNNTRSRWCNIEATLGKNAVNEGLTFTITQESLTYGGNNVNSSISTSIDTTTVDGVKIVKLVFDIPESMYPDNDVYTYPTGYVKIKASGGGVSKTITVNITCNPIAASTGNYLAGITRADGRYLAIPHSTQYGYDNTAELTKMLQSRNMSCEGLIREDYTLYDTSDVPLWYAYEGDDAKTKIFLEYMRHSKVVCVLSHGESTGISLNSSNSNIVLTAEQIYMLRDGYFDYCEMVIYSTCASGGTLSDNDTVNIMQATYAKGAKAVMGYSKSVNTNEAHYFEKTVLSVMNTDPNNAFVWPNASIAYEESEKYNCTPYEAVNHAKNECNFAAAEYAKILAVDETAQIS